MKVKVVFYDIKEKELVKLVEFPTPFFVDYIDIRTKNGKKEGYKIK